MVLGAAVRRLLAVQREEIICLDLLFLSDLSLLLGSLELHHLLSSVVLTGYLGRSKLKWDLKKKRSYLLISCIHVHIHNVAPLITAWLCMYTVCTLCTHICAVMYTQVFTALTHSFLFESLPNEFPLPFLWRVHFSLCTWDDETRCVTHRHGRHRLQSQPNKPSANEDFFSPSISSSYFFRILTLFNCIKKYW